MAMNTGIYVITCIANGRCYVGSAVNVAKRWREHRRQLGAGEHHSRFMQRSWVKYGGHAFEFKLVAVCAKETLIWYEQRFIDGLMPEFNSAPTAGSQLGYKHRPESRLRMSESRAKDFSPFTGRRHSEESKRMIAEARKGKACGKRPSEWLKSLSAAQKGRLISPEHRARISAKLLGHKQSPEQIEKRMQKIRGRKMPAGFAEAQSARRIGMKFEPEHCVNIGRSKAKLSDTDVREIRALLIAGEKQKAVAVRYGVDPSVISTIKTRTAYAWVE